MPVINGNNSQFNNSPVWAVLSPWTMSVTTNAMWFGRSEYRLDRELCLTANGTVKATGQFVTMAMNGKCGYGTDQGQWDGQFSISPIGLNMSVRVIAALTDDTVHYQPHSNVLRPGMLTSIYQAAAAETR